MEFQTAIINLVSHLKENRKDLLVFVILFLALFTFPLLICSLVVAGTANAGFNVVLTALLDCGFVAGSFYVVKYSKTPIAIGFLIGTSASLSILNLMTAIYWGQLSYCQHYSESFAQYSCSMPAAYGAVCFFSVFLFLNQLLFTYLVITSRGDLINEEGLYETTPSSSYSPYIPVSSDVSADL